MVRWEIYRNAVSNGDMMTLNRVIPFSTSVREIFTIEDMIEMDKMIKEEKKREINRLYGKMDVNVKGVIVDERV